MAYIDLKMTIISVIAVTICSTAKILYLDRPINDWCNDSKNHSKLFLNMNVLFNIISINSIINNKIFEASESTKSFVELTYMPL